MQHKNRLPGLNQNPYPCKHLLKRFTLIENYPLFPGLFSSKDFLYVP